MNAPKSVLIEISCLYLYQKNLMSLCFFFVFVFSIGYCVLHFRALQPINPLGPKGATPTYSQVLRQCSVCFFKYTQFRKMTKM